MDFFLLFSMSFDVCLRMSERGSGEDTTAVSLTPQENT